MKRSKKVGSIVRGDTTVILSWLIKYTRRASILLLLGGSAYEAAEAAKWEITSSAYRHWGGVSGAVFGLAAEPRAPNYGVIWERVKTSFPGETCASISKPASVAVDVNSTESEGGGCSQLVFI